MATPRILAAESEQQRRRDPGKAARGEEQRKAEEVRTTAHCSAAERSDGGGTLDDDDGARTDASERLGPRGEPDERVADDWDAWIAEQQRQADAALGSAVRALALQRTTSNAPIHDGSGKTVSEERHDGGGTLEDDEWAWANTPELAAQGGDKEEQADDEWDEWIAEEQRKADAALMSAVMALPSTHGTAEEPLEDDRCGWNGWAAQDLCRELAGD